MTEEQQQNPTEDNNQPARPGGQQIDTGGGASIGGDADVGHDLIGRDQIVNQGDLFVQNALSAVDEAQKAQAVEAERLAQGVKDYVQRLIAVATAESEGGPYRGLVAYRLRDAGIFFGRSRAIGSLLEVLQRDHLTVLQSESGAGKSSLLWAGIAPRLLGRGDLPVILRPYDLSPSLKIKQAFLPNLARTPDLAGAPLRDLLHQVTGVLGPATTLLLVLDQFEEFFTLLTDVEERTAFVSELAECLEDETLNVRWVLAMRSEFFGDLATFRPRIRNPFRNDFRLNRLTEEEAREVIVKPAARAGLAYEDELVDQLLTDLRQPDGEIDPPQVQLVCLALYNAYRERAADNADLPVVITLALYQEEGEARGILRNHLNRVLRRALPTQEERELARRLLIELVSADQRRIRRTRSDLARQLATGIVGAQSLAEVLEELVENRLVNVEQADEDEEAVYELAHDYLLDEIQLDPEVQAQKAAQELLAQEVEAYQRFDTLLSAQKFEIINSQRAYLTLDDAAEELLQRSENAIHQEEQEWEAARQRELEQAKQLATTQRQRLVWVSAVGVIALTLAVLAGVFYFQAQRNAQLAQDKLEQVEAERLLVEAREHKANLEPHAAIAKFQAALDAAQKADANLRIDLSDEISDTLRYVATAWVQQGEELLREANASEDEAIREQTVLSATALFSSALALNPPSDKPVYVWIPPGEFLMGSDPEVDSMANDDELDQHTVPLDGFWIMRTEVTNAQYNRCIDEGPCTTNVYERRHPQFADQPVVGTDWYQAQEYAAWVGGRLPTEAEWEKACRGTDSRIYPWGNDLPSPALLNYDESGLGDANDVGSYAPGANGLYDMSGNVWEWTSSKYKPYPYDPNDGREDPEGEEDRTFRGGSFDDAAHVVRCAYRVWGYPLGRSDHYGFRVVVPPPAVEL